MREEELRTRLETEMRGFQNKKILFFIIPTPYFEDAKKILALIATQKLKMRGLYITTGTPYPQLSTELAESGSETEKLFFIDDTLVPVNRLPKKQNCLIIQNPESLTELSLAITETANGGQFDFLFLDSLSGLLGYHNPETLGKFAHYLATRLKAMELAGILLARDETGLAKILPVYAQFCDKCVILPR